MNFSRILGIASAFVVGLVGLTVIFGSWYTIDDGYRGVVLRNGAIVGTANPGLNFKTPWIEEVEYISIRDHTAIYGKDENNLFQAYSRDQQIADLVVSVNYRVPVDRVQEVYTQYGSVENMVSRLLDRQIYEKTKTVFGQFSAASAIQERGRLNREISEAITNTISGPIIVSSIQVEDISYSPAYEASIEERMKAEVEVQKMKQQHEQAKVQAEILVTEANAKADAVRAEAQANAEAIEMKGNAEAKAIAARGKSLRDNSNLVSLVQAERWDGKLPSSMIPNGTVPFLDVNPTPVQ